MSLYSPFTHRLQKNYLAQPDEEPGIKEVIEQQHAAIRELDLELEDIDRAIKALRSRRKAILGRRKTHQTFADHHKSPLTGIPHLPEDILAKIFMDFIPSDGNWPSTHPIIPISHVCRQWRHSASANPMLWTTLDAGDLSLPEDASEVNLQDFERRMQRLANMFSTLISRAATSPMTLTINADGSTSQPIAPTYVRAVSAVIKVLREAQLEKIRLHLTPHHPDSHLLQLLEFSTQNCGNLREVEVHLGSDSTITANDLISRLDLTRMDQLSVLHLDLLQISPLNVQIRWKSLTEVHLYTTLPAPDLVEIMTQCPNITRFTTAVVDSAPSPQLLHPRHPITLPHLHTLRVMGEMRELGHSLVLPALRTLQIMEVRSGRSETSVPQWLRNYGSQLKQVAFSYDRISHSTLLSCLKYASAATSLEIGPFPLSPERRVEEVLSELHRSVLDALTAKPDEAGAYTCLCPKLERIVIHTPNLKMEIGPT